MIISLSATLASMPNNSECHCQKSVYYGMALEQIPWDGCPCFLSQRKWSVHDKPKKKRRKKYPNMEEYEFGV